jgi:Asp-tRNA(Asn)/Glu-tRNA(Gln) amidotransferase B subunit
MLFFDNNYKGYDVGMYKDIKEIINNKGLALLNIRGDDTINDICREIIQDNNEFFIAEVTEKEVREWLNNDEFLFKYCFDK